MTITAFVVAALYGLTVLFVIAVCRAAARGDDQLRDALTQIDDLRRDVDDGGH